MGDAGSTALRTASFKESTGFSAGIPFLTASARNGADAGGLSRPLWPGAVRHVHMVDVAAGAVSEQRDDLASESLTQIEFEVERIIGRIFPVPPTVSTCRAKTLRTARF